MKKIFTTLFLLSIVGVTIFAQSPKREMRAAWLATVSNLDWPRSGNSAITVPVETGSNEAARQAAITTQKNALITFFDRLQAGNMNAVFFQVRPMCDAFYQSSFEPWSQYLSASRGAYPGWDPLQFAIEEAHKRGMELHAWLNPYRYSTNANNHGNLSTDYPAANPGWLIDYGNSRKILNPALPEVTQRITDIVAEIITNYNVDGIVFDDYFYVGRGETTLTLAEYDALDNAHFIANNPNGLSRGDWRRANCNRMVKAVYDRIQSIKPYVTFGMSPAGVAASSPTVAAKYGVPPCPTGADWQYDGIFAEPLAWLVEGSIDYISPQCYVTINSETETGTDYSLLVPWWSQVANKFEKHFYSSQYVFSNTENANQLKLNRDHDLNGAPGSVYFRMNDLNTSIMSYLAANQFRYKALTPAISWKPAPAQDMVDALNLAGQTLSWTHNENVRYAVYAVPNAQKDDPQVFATSLYLQGISYTKQYTLPTGASATTHRIAVSVLDHYGNEYAPRVLNESSATPVAANLIYPADNATVVLPALFTWESVSEAAGYVWQIARDAGFNDVITSRETAEPQFNIGLLGSLKTDIRYYWRVKTLKTNGGEAWSESRSFTGKILAKISNVEMRNDLNNKVDFRYPIYITFSHKMNKTTVETATGILPAANLSLSWFTDYTLKVDISKLAFETDYTLTINGSIAKDSEMNNFLDGAGNNTEGSNYVLNFTTCDPDTDPPVIKSYDPQGNQEISARPIVRIEFDEPLNESSLTGKITVADKSGNPVEGVQSYQAMSNFKSVMHYIFLADLKPQEPYTVTLASGVEDMYGNKISGDFTFDFTTRPREKTLVTVIDDFNTLASSWFQPSASGTTIGINTTASVVSRNTQVMPAVESTGSVRMNYLWLPTSATPVLRWHNTLVAPKFSRSNVIQYYLFGDGSNSSVAVVLRNGSTGDMWGHQRITLDWVGWKLITWNMASDPVVTHVTGSTTTLPVGDVLNLSCFVVYPAPLAERYFEVSSIYFSQLRVVQLGNYIPSGMNEILVDDGINVSLMPDFIDVSANTAINDIRVYSITGILLKSIQPRQISYQIPTNNLMPGVHIVKVVTGTSQKNVKVLVK